MVLKNKKALRLVVCMSLIAALAFAALGISVAATYENTHYNSGNQASDIVGIAQTQVGYSEGYDGYTKYGDWYGLPNSDWCAMFVSWCADQAGVDTSTFPKFALCSAGADWFISQGRFQYSGSYAPKAGDLIFYSSYGDIYHVGLVTGSDDSNVYSIEGNYCEAVYNVSYPLSYGDILGYATPDYTYSDGSAQLTAQNEETTSVVSDDKTNDDEDEFVEEEDVDSENDDETDSNVEEVVSETVSYEEVESKVEEVTTETVSSEEEKVEVEEDVVSDTNTNDDNNDSDVKEDSDNNVKTDDDTVSFKLGDVNKDGKITAIDALYIQRYLVYGSNVDGISLVSADYNQDGEVDLSDAIAILEISAGFKAE